MKWSLLSFLSMALHLQAASQPLKDGDIIFHTSKSRQSKMLQVATQSKYTHCGIIFFRNGIAFVYEAIQPVTVTSLVSWVKRGVGGRYTVVRLKGGMSSEQREKMLAYAKKQVGKNYDLKFQWSEDRMYCSELVWKCYSSADIELCRLGRFKDYNLGPEVVRKAIRERYVDGAFNPEETAVTPDEIKKSLKLATVFSNY